MHCSPDGPWFFLIAQSAANGDDSDAYRLIGITDTSMLRPQVFALQQFGKQGPAIGFAASEKQAIDAALESLSGEDRRFWSRADKYWNARGGSHTDGGAFIFSIEPNSEGHNGQNSNSSLKKLVCTDKFGVEVGVKTDQEPYVRGWSRNSVSILAAPSLSTSQLYAWFIDCIPNWSYVELLSHLYSLYNIDHQTAIETLTLLIDQRYPTGLLRRSSLLSIFDTVLHDVLRSIKNSHSEKYIHLEADRTFPQPSSDNQSAVVDAYGFNPEGERSLALAIVELYRVGYQNLIIYNTRGHRFIGNGLGRNTEGLHIDVYGSSGDYLASGLDGAEIHVHGSGQDQLAQIMKSGKLVVHGDVGQTFGYAAKGGSVFILGNAAGRPMINAVGKPRVIINGTCLDYLAESFMAGDPHNGGGFVILNGISIDDQGNISDMDTPYPGGNLFSLASGGAIYLRDPERKVSAGQLNGGDFQPMEELDWQLIRPYLEENERIFKVPLSRLLTGQNPSDIYRKIRPRAVRALQAEEAWVHKAN
jgi:glutamate synthase domain-containing protein 3